MAEKYKNKFQTEIIEKGEEFWSESYDNTAVTNWQEYQWGIIIRYL